MSNIIRSLDSTLEPNLINVQINSTDSYQSFPTALDKISSKSLPGLPFVQVPIVRFYGCLPTGHKILVHCHGVLPYIFIRYDGQMSDTSSEILNRCSNLHNILEIRMVETYTKNQMTEKFKSLKYVANVSVVKGVPFYGYHVGYEPFYKISLLNGSYVNKLSDLLRDGKILSSKVEVYEAHIPHLLQLMADYNLFGCGWLKLSQCYFRKPILLEDLEINEILYTESLERFLKTHLKPNENALDQDPFHRVGRTLLEIDILPQFIVNKQKIQFRDLHHDFIEITKDLQLSDQGYVNSTKDIWDEIQNIRKMKGLSEYQELDNYSRDPMLQYNWKDNTNLLNYFEAAKKRTSSLFPTKSLRFDSFVNVLQNEHLFPSPREALEELWPKIPRYISKKVQTFTEMHQNKDIYNKFGDKSDPFSIQQQHETFSVVNPLSSLNDSDSTTRSKRKASQSPSKSDNSINPESQIYTVPNKKLHQSISTRDHLKVLKRPRINFANIKESLLLKEIPEVVYPEPFYSNPLDLKRNTTEIADAVFKLSSDHVSFRKGMEYKNYSPVLTASDNVYQRSRWRYVRDKPTFQNVMQNNESCKKEFSAVVGKTPDLPFGYKFKSNNMNLQNFNSFNRMTHFTMELHVNSREDKYPDPKHDAVRMIFWKVQDGTFPFNLDITQEGLLIYSDNGTDRFLWNSADPTIHVTTYEDELSMIYALEDLVRFFDPDILSGYEIHSSSWGYLIDRCRFAHNYDVEEELSRVETNHNNKKKDSWGYTHATAFRITGRHMLNIWRHLRSSLNLLDYTLENIVFHVLHERFPFYSFKTLTGFFDSNDPSSKKCLINYYIKRVRVNYQLLETQNIIGKTIEQARLIGIEFYSVLYRGSQYKVESFLIRLCKSESFLLISPSRKQVRDQKALECIPLVMEPSSAFYNSPLLVLDFQSLYPSIVMAYNYCYSTMLGRVQTLGLKDNRIGTTTIDIPPDLLTLISDYVTVSPNGIAFVKKELRKSILAKMLKDILATRFLMKDTMNQLKDDHDVVSMLDNRQAALKLLANVTYGYTAASFSGRMPCSDIADSIVQTGRETLERAIEFIESTKKWGAKVVYGDTDSLFVYLPGKSRSDAFKIGKEIAKEITMKNPKPVELKFEKVYHPCFLVTKKRYVGYAYEYENQINPKFDAKGIETVRRDGTPAQQKIVERALRTMFETTDLSKVKEYLLGEFDKIITGRVNIQDFCFAREVKIGHYKSDKTAPPGAQIAMQMMEEDHRKEPQYKQRIPYVVKMGKMGETLSSRCISPEAFLRSKDSRLDYNYYIVKNIIPPLQRFFQLVGVDVMDWFSSMRKTMYVSNESAEHDKIDGRSVTSIVKARSCLRCRKRVHPEYISRICDECRKDKGNTIMALQEAVRLKQSKMHMILRTCQTCSYKFHKDAMAPLDSIALKCQSKDCPVYFSKVKYINGLKNTDMRDLLLGIIDLDY